MLYNPPVLSRWNQLLLPFSLCGALLFWLAACGSNPTSLTEIVLNLGTNPTTLDPAQVTDPPTIQILHLLFLNLTDLRESDGAPLPSLATDWSVSSDGLIWEFHLRRDVEWVRFSPTTGRTDRKRLVNADDVVYSVQRLFDPRTHSGFAPMFVSLIRNAEPFNDADPRTKPEDLDRLAQNLGVKKIDDDTVQFFLTRPDSAFPAVVGTWLGRLQPREAIADNGENWTDPGAMWTNGPYLFERWEPHQYILLRKNPYYFDAGHVQIDRLRFLMMTDEASIVDSYVSGGLDTTAPYDSLSGDTLERVNQDPALSADARIVPELCTHYFGFNVSRAPFDDARVRQAFAFGLNRAELVQALNVGDPARWFTHPAVLAAPVISDTLGIPFDVDHAKELLAQAGYGAGKRAFPQVTLEVNDNDTIDKIAVDAATQWKKNLGTEVRVEVKTWNELLKDLDSAPPNIFRLGYCAYVPDASNFTYDVFRSGAANNYTHWSNSAFDQLVDSAARETDVLKRRDLYRAAEKILSQDDVPIIPLWWGSRLTLTNKKIQRTFAVTEGYEQIENWTLK